jgi:hypothetical protein
VCRSIQFNIKIFIYVFCRIDNVGILKLRNADVENMIIKVPISNLKIIEIGRILNTYMTSDISSLVQDAEQVKYC